MSSPQTAGWMSTLGKGGRWLAGIVVVALVGALVSILVPRLFGPEELGAELSRVSIQAGMTLDEYAIRQQDTRSAEGERTAAAGDGPVTLMISAPAEPERAGRQTREATPPAAAPERVEATTTTTPTPPTTPTTPTTTTPTTPTTPPTTTTGAGDGPLVTRKLSPAAREALADGVADAIEATPQPIVITPGCHDDLLSQSCGLSSLASTMELAAGTPAIDTVSEENVAHELARVFRGTRTVRSPEDPRKRELVGAAVDFKLALTGFRGRTVQVRWSLYSATQRVRVPRAWLRNQRIMLLRGEADRDSASGQFWVPIPQLRGPFFIRVGVYDGRGGRLDYADTDAFR